MVSAILGISIALVVFSRNVRVMQSATADFLHINSVYLSEPGLNFRRHNFLVGDRLDDLVGNNLPVRDPDTFRRLG